MPSPRPQNTLICGPALLASLRGCTLGSLSLTILATSVGTPSFRSLPIRLSTISGARCVWIFREHVLTLPQFSLASDAAVGCCMSATFLKEAKILNSPLSGHPATLTGFPLELHLLALGRKEYPTEVEETASHMNSAPHPEAQDGPTLPAVFTGTMGGKSWEEKGCFCCLCVNQMRRCLASDFVWLLCGPFRKSGFMVPWFSAVGTVTNSSSGNSMNLARRH